MLGRGEPDDELLALLALDALDDTERAEVERAVAESPRLQRRLEEHRSVAASLARSVAEEPPPDLKSRVLAAAFAESPPREVPPAEAPAVVLDLERSHRRRRLVRGLVTAVAAAAVVAGALVFVGRGEDDPSGARAVLVGDPGSVVVESADGRIVLSASGLDPLDDDETYQLWLVQPDQTVRSAGLFRTSADGSVDASLPGGFGDAVGLAVSLEPAGGSPDPAAPSGPVTFTASLS